MSRLPPSLAPWSESLADLDPALAVDLGPMIHALDELVGRIDSSAGESGSLDGYDGMTNRGDPDLLLASEWLLAEEVPFEFLRRAAENELLYLRRAHQSVRTHGRVVAVVDSGPEQLGAGRLVQLAALVVLDRRATSAGAELSLADLQSGHVMSGSLASLLPAWRRLRSPRSVTTDDIERVMSGIKSDDKAWVLTGQTTGRQMSGHRRKIVTQVSDWGSAGASEVTIRVGEASTKLALPAPARAVAALRGEGLTRHTRREVDAVRVAETGRGAVFNSDEPELLWRGGSRGELYAMRVRADTKPKVRKYVLPGDVLAAAYLGRRLVAVLAEGRRVRVHVRGKHLARVNEIDHSIGDLDLSPQDLEQILAEPVRPLYFSDGHIFLQLRDDVWCELGLQGVDRAAILAMAPGHALDSPRQLRASEEGFYLSPMRDVEVLFEDAGLFQGPLLGAGGHVAWADRPRVWTVRGRDGHQYPDIGTGEDDLVVGVTNVGGVPGLVTVTASGRIVRLVTAQSSKTWTAWAGPAHFDVHPSLAWLVRSDSQGILVGDMRTGESLLDVKVAE